MAAAITRGGRDNITALIVDVIDDSDPAYLASLELGGASSNAEGSTVIGPSSGEAATTRTRHARPAESKGSPRRAPVAHTGAQKVKRPRKPSPVNLRVLFFMAILGGLAAIVAWVWKNAPANDIVPSTTVVTTESSTPAGPVVPTTASVTSKLGTGTTIAGSTVPATSVAGTSVAGTTVVRTPAGATSGSEVTPGTNVRETSVVTLAPTTTDPFGEPATTKTTKTPKTTRKKTK